MDGLGGIGDLDNETHFATTTFSDGYSDGFLVHIQSNVFAKLIHDLPPQLRLCEWG